MGLTVSGERDRDRKVKRYSQHREGVRNGAGGRDFCGAGGEGAAVVDVPGDSQAES